MWPEFTLPPILAFSVFLIGFLYWRRLKNDYPPQALLSTYFLSVLFLFTLPVIANLLLVKAKISFPQAEIFSWTGALIGFLLSIRLFRKEKINFWEVADFLWLSLSGLAMIFHLFRIITALISPPQPFISHLFALGWWLSVWGMSFLLSFSFRQISWYKSGKVGLSATLGPAIYFLGAGLLAFFLPAGLYWTQINPALKPVFMYIPISIFLIALVILRSELKLETLDIKNKISQIKNRDQKDVPKKL